MTKATGLARLTLAEAAALVVDRAQFESDEARKGLLALLRSGEIVARGALPLNYHGDIEWAWKHTAATRVEEVPPSAWYLDVDWDRGRVGRYREITIAQAELTATFRSARGPGRRATPHMVEEAVEQYVRQERGVNSSPTQSGCWNYVKKCLPKATRAQVFSALAKHEPVKPRGRPGKKV